MTTTETKRAGFQISLGMQIFIGAILGLLLGLVIPHLPVDGSINHDGTLEVCKRTQDIFLLLIKMMVAPLVFACLVQGIAGSGEMKKVGRIGVKAVIYFEILTTIALGVGLLAVNLLQPGVGVVIPNNGNTVDVSKLAKPLTLGETIEHIFPSSIADAMAKDDVLQIVCFAIFFALAIAKAGEEGKQILAICNSLRHVMFSFAQIIMKAAPIGVMAALAYTVGFNGVGVILNLGKLVLTLYIALAFFIVVVFGSVIAIFRIPLLPFIRATWEIFTLAFATANSEAALPMAFSRMERFGVPRGIVGFVLPMGYSFNLDGSTLYLAVASVFVAQAAGNDFNLWKQWLMMSVLMLTSKGVAAVPRASFVVLVAAAQSFNLPAAGCALIVGVDAFMDMARTSVNVLGNCLASVVIAIWEGEFDREKALREFGTAAAAVAAEEKIN